MEKYQTLLARIAAAIVDVLIFAPFMFLDEWVRAINVPPDALIIWFLAFNLSGNVYTTLMHGLYGQTLGKMVMKVKVLDISESPITFKQAFVRDLPILIITLGFIFLEILSLPQPSDDLIFSPSYPPNIFYAITLLLFLAVVASPFFNSKRRALHDFIAGTVVVKTQFSLVGEKA